MKTLREIKPGDLIRVRSMTGLVERRATTGVVPGHKFPVVWAAREEEYDGALSEGREPEAMPWPAEDVESVEDAGSAQEA